MPKYEGFFSEDKQTDWFFEINCHSLLFSSLNCDVPLNGKIKWCISKIPSCQFLKTKLRTKFHHQKIGSKAGEVDWRFHSLLYGLAIKAQCLWRRKFFKVLVKTVDQQQFVTPICGGRDRTALTLSKYQTRHLVIVTVFLMVLCYIQTWLFFF